MEAVKGFQEEVEYNAKGKAILVSKIRPDILVGIIGVLSTGLTLYRANRLILIEPSSAKSTKE